MYKFHHLIESSYPIPNINQDIALLDESVDLKTDSLEIEGKARVSMKFLPKPQIVIKANCPPDNFGVLNTIQSGQKLYITFPALQLSTEVRPTKISVKKDCQITAIPLKRILTIGQTRNITQIVFYLLNFPHFLGADGVFVTEKKKKYRIGDISLEADGWKIVLKSVQKLKTKIEELESQGGYGITHVGLVTQKSGKSFSLKKTNMLLQVLFYFLSFCRGFFTGPILLVGFNKKNERILEQWDVVLKD